MDVFVARQPIFDEGQNIFAYKLLFRDHIETIIETKDQDNVATDVIANSFLLMNVETLTSGKKVLIKFTSNLLKMELATVLPPNKVIIELSQDLELDEQTIFKCIKLKNLGYKFALNDFNLNSKFDMLVNLADIIKINFKTTSLEEQKDIFNKLNGRNLIFLAEKIETDEELQTAKNLGYKYFQGFYFSKPVVVSAKDIPLDKLNYLKLLQEINKPELNFNQLEVLIKGNISLSYKLLKFVNSSTFNFREKISSVRHALALLGEKEIRKWFSLIILRGISDEKSNELVATSCVRASFAELLAYKVHFQNQSSNIFLMGLFSLIDVLLGRPLAEILEEVYLPEDIKWALLGIQNDYKDILDLIVAYENGDWASVGFSREKLNIQEHEIPNLYLQAVERTNMLLGTELS